MREKERGGGTGEETKEGYLNIIRDADIELSERLRQGRCGYRYKKEH